MYSVVLLMALSGGAEAPDCHRSNCSCACTGAPVVVTCSGGGYACCGGGRHGGGLFGGHGCHGGGLFSRKHGGHGCHGASVCCGGAPVVYPCCGGAAPLPPPPVKGEKVPLPKEKKGEEVAAPATIVLSLPADAKVSIDGALTNSTSATRTFVTPELAPAQDFVYTLSAQIVRNGQTLTVSEKVSVRAGEETRVNFGTEQFSTLTVAAK